MDERTAAQVPDDRLAHNFRLAVRTVRFETGRFGDRDDGGRAVDGRAGRVHDAGAVKLGHGLQQVDRRRDVVLIVCQRDLGRLTHGLVCLQHVCPLGPCLAHATGTRGETHRNVNDTPDAALAILVKHAPDLVAAGEIAGKDVNFSAVAVLC